MSSPRCHSNNWARWRGVAFLAGRVMSAACRSDTPRGSQAQSASVVLAGWSEASFSVRTVTTGEEEKVSPALDEAASDDTLFRNRP